MSRIHVLIAVLMLLLLGTFLWSTSSIISDFGQAQCRAQNDLGKVFVSGADTLVVVDYSLMDETYTLSDGRKINFKILRDEK